MTRKDAAAVRRMFMAETGGVGVGSRGKRKGRQWRGETSSVSKFCFGTSADFGRDEVVSEVFLYT